MKGHLEAHNPSPNETDNFLSILSLTYMSFAFSDFQRPCALKISVIYSIICGSRNPTTSHRMKSNFLESYPMSYKLRKKTSLILV